LKDAKVEVENQKSEIDSRSDINERLLELFLPLPLKNLTNDNITKSQTEDNISKSQTKDNIIKSSNRK